MRFLYFIIIIIQVKLVFADVKLPSIFTDHMVIQQQSNIQFWGWAKPNEKIKVTTSWDGKTYSDSTNHTGQWKVYITTPSYGGPYEIIVQGYNKVELKDILIGEVWLVSGQSNMEWSASSGIIDADNEVKQANYPNLRFFKTYVMAAQHPQENLDGEWTICTPETMNSFSAIGYFFGSKLLTDLKIPIGVISSSWGGTPAEAWTPSYAINKDLILAKNIVEKKQDPWGPKDPGTIYNAMIYPIKNTKIKGVLWYQGESNTSHSKDYERLLTTMVAAWRKEFNQAFPFYLVQIAPYTYGGTSGVELRDAQRRASVSIPDADMVVISDIGDIKDIHPKNKKDVGQRLANIALKNQYGKSSLITSGPTIKQHSSDKNNIIITYNTQGDLICNEGCKKSFEVGDAAGNMKKADVVIKGNTITLSAKGILYPVSARWNWCSTCSELLTDQSRLPSSAFFID